MSPATPVSRWCRVQRRQPKQLPPWYRWLPPCLGRTTATHPTSPQLQVFFLQRPLRFLQAQVSWRHLQWATCSSKTSPRNLPNLSRKTTGARCVARPSVMSTTWIVTSYPIQMRSPLSATSASNALKERIEWPTMFDLTTEGSTSPMCVLCVEKAFPGKPHIALCKESF